jgi:glycosyltransferase involved in cell wall biosynthesis
MGTPRFSVIIPARNEELFIGLCLESIRTAAVAFEGQVETIVVLNRSCDKTEAIAHAFGARTTRENARNLARIRNAGARLATGSILVTIDADSRMTPGTLVAIDRVLSSGMTVGGGIRIYPDRWSLGIRVTLLLFRLLLAFHRVSLGLFWCYRKDFETIGGFHEDLVSGEDLDFARRLRAYGQRMRRSFMTLPDEHIVTSCRKFDTFGDWFVLKNPVLVCRLVRGTSQHTADVLYYDFER